MDKTTTRNSTFIRCVQMERLSSGSMMTSWYHGDQERWQPTTDQL